MGHGLLLQLLYKCNMHIFNRGNETFGNCVQCCRFLDKNIATVFRANNNDFRFLIII